MESTHGRGEGEEMFFSACKNNLLQMCNDLLRRLSQSQNTVSCRKIVLFIAKFSHLLNDLV
jgi:THO complex subunit 1 transcription elongation factor.